MLAKGSTHGTAETSASNEINRIPSSSTHSVSHRDDILFRTGLPACIVFLHQSANAKQQSTPRKGIIVWRRITFFFKFTFCSSSGIFLVHKLSLTPRTFLIFSFSYTLFPNCFVVCRLNTVSPHHPVSNIIVLALVIERKMWTEKKYKWRKAHNLCEKQKDLVEYSFSS